MQGDIFSFIYNLILVRLVYETLFAVILHALCLRLILRDKAHCMLIALSKFGEKRKKEKGKEM